MHSSSVGFAAQQYAKSYYPHGIIARRSMKVSPVQRAMFYGPLGAFFLYAAWCHKEYPRTQRVSYVDDNEE